MEFQGSHSAYCSAREITEQEIPIIDIGALLGGAEGAVEEVAQQIVQASQRIGFFYIRNHGIAASVIESATSAMRSYFALPLATKRACAVNKAQRGWMEIGQARLEGSATHDLKEVFFWGPEAYQDTEGKPAESLVSANLWPDADFPVLRQNLLPYYQAVQQVGHRLLAAIAVGLGAPKDFFVSRYTEPLARGQLVYYPVSSAGDENQQRFGSAPHTDFGVLTLLLQDANGGLQVRNRQGEWVAALPVEGTLVCNIGDLMNRWSNEVLSSNLHRVINQSGRERHSLVVFFDPNAEAIIDPGDLGFPEGRARFPAISAADYIHGKNRKNFTHYGSTSTSA